MPDIFHDFPINVAPSRVFQAVSIPADLDQWWTERSSGEPRLGAEYQLWFGPLFDWRAIVERCEPGKTFEFEITQSEDEWLGTKIGFQLEGTNDITQVRSTTADGRWRRRTIESRVTAGRCISGS